MKRDRLLYWIFTGLLSAMMLFSASMYILKNADIQAAFTSFGYPTYIIYPLAIAKILGVIAIVSNYNRSLKEWAYAGFFFDFLLAFGAHWAIKDGEHMGAVMATVLLLLSYFFWHRLRQQGAA